MASHTRFHKIKHWIKSNRWGFKLSGAVLIFLTFVVRDIYRDNLKEAVDSYNNIETIVTLGSAIDGVRQAVGNSRNAIETALHDLNLPQKKQDSLADHAYKAMWTLSELQERLSTITEENERTGDFIAHKPELSASNTAVTTRQEELKNLQNEFDAIRLSLLAGLDAKGLSGKRIDPGRLSLKPEETINRVGTLPERVAVLEVEAEGLNSEIRDALRSQKEELERKYSKYKKSSWFLYALGFILAFIGGSEGSE